MYHVLVYGNHILYEAVPTREALNMKANETCQELNGYLPYDGVSEERVYGDGKMSYSEFLKYNPKLSLSIKNQIGLRIMVLNIDQFNEIMDQKQIGQMVKDIEDIRAGVVADYEDAGWSCG